MENQVHISNDMIFEILLKLPAKSVAKFSCVSKDWLSIIRSKPFIKNYMSRSLKRPCFLLSYARYANPGLQLHFNSVSQDDPSPSEYHRTMVVIPYPHYSDISPPTRGFICIRYNSKIFICNPTTSQLFPLPEVTTSTTDIEFFLGYDPINDQYKVLCMTLLPQRRGPILSEEHQVFTVGVNRPWRNIECKFPHRSETEGVCKNGVIYYGAWSKSNLSREKYVIIGFDVKSEVFSVVELSEDIQISNAGNRTELFIYEGKLGLMNHRLLGNASDLWILEDVKKQKWCRIHVILGLPMMNLWCKGSLGNKELVFSHVGFTIDNFFVWCRHMDTHSFRIIRFQQLTHLDITLDLDHVHNPFFL